MPKPKQENDASLEQYRIYVETVEKVTDRRAQANRFYLLLHSGILTILSTVLTVFLSQEMRATFPLGNQLLPLAIKTSLCAVSVLGMFICVLWFLTLISYKQLNRAKFKVLFEIEKRLSVRCFNLEWKLLGEGKDPKKYFEFTRVEIILPTFLFLSYLAVMVLNFVLLAA